MPTRRPDWPSERPGRRVPCDTPGALVHSAAVGLFDRFRRRRDDGPSATSSPNAQAVAELKAFLADRQGVEGFIEPQTSVYAMTLLLVAGDGEYLRRPVKHEKQARKLCEEHGVPLYAVRKVGYPQRMKDYERGIRRKAVSLEDLPPLDVTDERDG